MKIAITAKMRNGLLWEAVKKAGSQAALARQLGVTPSTLGVWLNFKRVPAYDSPNHAERRAELEAKLVKMVGATFDEVFPPEIRSEAFQRRHKQIERTLDVPMDQLIGTGALPQLPPSPEEVVFSGERSSIIDGVLETLSERERKVVEMRFGLNGQPAHELSEVGAKMGLGKARVGQIEKKALQKLRHPSRALKLENAFLEPSEIRDREIEKQEQRKAEFARAEQIAEEARRHQRQMKIDERQRREAAQAELHRRGEVSTRNHKAFLFLCNALVVPKSWLSSSAWMNANAEVRTVEGDGFTATIEPVYRLIRAGETGVRLRQLVKLLNHPDMLSFVQVTA